MMFMEVMMIWQTKLKSENRLNYREIEIIAIQNISWDFIILLQPTEAITFFCWPVGPNDELFLSLEYHGADMARSVSTEHWISSSNFVKFIITKLQQGALPSLD